MTASYTHLDRVASAIQTAYLATAPGDVPILSSEVRRQMAQAVIDELKLTEEYATSMGTPAFFVHGRYPYKDLADAERELATIKSNNKRWQEKEKELPDWAANPFIESRLVSEWKIPDQVVFDWIQEHYAKPMGKRLLDIHRRILIDQDYSELLPADLDKVIQTVNHARACIRAGHEPLPLPSESA